MAEQTYLPNGDEDISISVEAGMRAGASDVLPEANAPITLRFADAADKQAFANTVKRWIEAGRDARRDSGFDERVVAFRNQYEGVTQPRTTPWEGAANIHVPDTRSITDTLVAQLYKTIFGVSPIFQVTADNPTQMEAAEAIEAAMQTVAVDLLKLPRVARECFRRSLIDKMAIMVPTWEVRVEKKRSWERVTQALADEISADAKMRKNNAGVLDQWAVYARKVAEQQEQMEAMKAAVQIATAAAPTEGVPVPAPPAPPEPLWAAIWREKIVYDAAALRRVDILDFGVYPADAPTLVDSLAMFDRYWQTRGQLRAGVLSGRYDKDAVDALLEKGPTGNTRASYDANRDTERTTGEGIGRDSERTTKERPYECFTVLVRWDVDDDGEEELCLVEIELATATILRAELYPYWHDAPFYCTLNVLPRDGHLYGYSICEILEHLQEEVNTMHNQRTDRANLENNAPMVMRAGMKNQLDKKYVHPGLIITADDPRDALFPMPVGNGAQASVELEGEVRSMMQMVSAVNNTLQGQAQGGDTTYSEIERALQSVNTLYDLLLDGIREQLAEGVGYQVKGLYMQFQPPEFSFKMIGDDGAPLMGPDGAPLFGTVTRAQMESDVSFVVHGTSSLDNPVLQYQMAEKAIMFAERSPFVQADLTRRYHLDKNYLKNGLKLKDWQKMIGTPQQAEEMKQAAQSAPPAPPESRVSITERRDEVLTLAFSLDPTVPMTEERYMAAVALAARAQASFMPKPPNVTEQAATDQPAGYPKQEPAAVPSTGQGVTK